MGRREEWRIDGTGETRLVLAHGAGAPMDSPFMEAVAQGAARRGLQVIRFEFPYMRARRRRPDPPAVLRDTWLSVVEELGGGPALILGGKSMGGRVASMIADEVAARGLVCLGYPFHPPGRPDELRTAHLATIAAPTLIVQGTRDALGRREEVEGYELSPNVRVEFLEDGDHSFKPPARSEHTQERHILRAVELVAAFARSLG